MSVDAEPIRTDEWSDAPALTDAALTGTFWSFGPLGEPPHCPFLVLAPGGRIGNFYHPNEEHWQITDGRLEFTSSDGLPTTTYRFAHFRGGLLHALAGPISVPGFDGFHQLRRCEHPPHPFEVSPPDIDRRATFLGPPAGSRRANLVVLRAGENSLHNTWRGDAAADPDRNWDLCISYYGKDLGNLSGRPEYLAHQPLQRKFQAIYDLFHPSSPLWNYDRIWLPDDDLATSWADINRMFHLSRKYGLLLSQPSLRPGPDCFISHEIVAQRQNSILRYVDFVEVMCPVFSRVALEICLGTFRDSISSFGLDYLWPSLLGQPHAGVAVIDKVALVHTRPVGGSFSFDRTLEEERGMLANYRLTRRPFKQVMIEDETAP